MAKKLTLSEVIDKFREVHGDFYDYSKFEYINARTKGIIICPNHGEFEQKSDDHKNGRGCPRCAFEKNSTNRTLSKDVVIQQFRDKHDDFYDYSKFIYVNAITKGIIICPIHGEFLQRSSDHKRGKGCAKCAHVASSKRAKGGYDSLSPEQRTKIKDVYLYHLELQYGGSIFHKIGITGNPQSRFSGIQRKSKSHIINGWTHMYKNAEIAFRKEQKILDYMMFDRSEKWYHPIEFDGKTECFLPVPNPHGWNLDLNNIPQKSPRFNYNDAFE